MAKTKHKTLPDRCPEHAVQDLDMVSAAIDADERIERGEHQEQCAKCERWLWADERGAGFVSTGKSDRD